MSDKNQLTGNGSFALSANAETESVNPATISAAIGASTNKATANAIGSVSESEIDFIDLDGITGPKDFWERIASPDLMEFKENPSARTAFHLAWSLWSLIDWLWFDKNPDKSNRGSHFEIFRNDHLSHCLDLSYVRDFAEAAKHRGLNRKKPPIHTMGTNSPSLVIKLKNGTVLSMHSVFQNAAVYLATVVSSL